ncbi:N-carbamoylputrescine amidase [Luminiphilus syltensis NOR5-1B]|uniref:N-carbamoylputrescine amidase n=1 Tax=Luminiphilus syltensis NOR5-1B TaxID=565045 RepID=B8KSW7_9GAMM|nr:carbon-nitrogen hydrolase [Luminiphilus syltensis]EED34229.1 N-carbamoylputrescine amidase [Luminiphilus syltensis NOR5-1B]
MDILRAPALPSLCPHDRVSRPLTIALYQMRWYPDPEAHKRRIEEGVAAAAMAGAQIVFLPELTLSRYPADTLPEGRADTTAEPLADGPTFLFAAELAKRYDLHVHASLFQLSGADDGRGLNTAIVVSPNGELIAHTHKLHIPVTTGYYEDHYFAPGPNEAPYPVHHMAFDSGDAALGLPTCWDEWFPEVARNYALRGAEMLAYPTAIGSEPDFPDFDTEPLWRQTIVGHAIANGLFIAVPNRFGGEGTVEFYGSSFIVDPFGRLLAQAPRDKEVTLVADIDLGWREDWLTLFPFLATRRPDTYAALCDDVANPRTQGGHGAAGGIAGIKPQ